MQCTNTVLYTEGTDPRLTLSRPQAAADILYGVGFCGVECYTLSLGGSIFFLLCRTLVKTVHVNEINDIHPWTLVLPG